MPRMTKLDREAEQLARDLVARGICPQAILGANLPRIDERPKTKTGHDGHNHEGTES